MVVLLAALLIVARRPPSKGLDETHQRRQIFEAAVFSAIPASSDRDAIVATSRPG